MGIRSFLAALAFTATAATGAFAADIAPVAQYDWSGYYAGLYAGYGFGGSHIFDNQINTGVTDFDSSFSLNGAIIGARGGWNQQRGQFVWGLEGDVGYNGASSATPWPFGTSSTAKVDMDASLRLRAGIAHDKALFYITGGPALGHVVADYYDTGGRHDNVSTLAFGYTVGAGAEFAVSNNWLVGAEARFTNYGDAKGRTTTTDSNWYETNQIHETSVRLTVSKHF